MPKSTSLIMTLAGLAMLGLAFLCQPAQCRDAEDSCVIPKLTIARLDSPLPSWHRLVVGGLNPYANKDAVAFGQILLLGKDGEVRARAPFFIDWSPGGALDIIIPVHCEGSWASARIELEGCYPIQ